jgi:hypothetical protein
MARLVHDGTLRNARGGGTGGEPGPERVTGEPGRIKIDGGGG